MSFIAFSGLKNVLLSSPSRLKVWSGTTKERKKRRKKEKKRRKEIFPEEKKKREKKKKKKHISGAPAPFRDSRRGQPAASFLFFVANKVNKAFFAFVS